MSNKLTHVEPGTVIDNKYRILGRLGAGGMGTVYKAEHIPLKRKVALKLLHMEFISDPQVITRFQLEAQCAASIGHDNICEVTDLGTSKDGAPYLVMPLLRGTSFADLLKKTEVISLWRIGDIICQTLSALQAAHNEKIIHRDLKPDNIFITKLGDREDFVKLLDFGISKVLDQDSVSELTRTGTIVGTPFYMAPEQAKGSKSFDHRVDLYAVGVILYEALTGKRPFEGDSYNEIMFKILTEPYQPPRSLNTTTPVAVEKVVLKAMERDPAQRFASAEEMRNTLEQAVFNEAREDAPNITRAVTAIASNTPFTPTGMGAARTPASQPSLSRSSPEKSRAAHRAKSHKNAIALLVVAAIVVIGAVGLALYMLGKPDEPAAAVVPVVPMEQPPMAKPAAQDSEPKPPSEPMLKPADVLPATASEPTALSEPTAGDDSGEKPQKGDDKREKAQKDEKTSEDSSSSRSSQRRSRKKNDGSTSRKKTKDKRSKKPSEFVEDYDEE